MDARFRRLLTGFAAGMIGLFMAGCTTPYGEPNHTGTGALVGGLGGAGLGALLSHGHPAGALLGGAAGAITGGIIGNSMDQQSRTPVYVAGPPPVPVAPPPPRYVWVNGQWVWNGAAWVWAPPHWGVLP